MDILKETGELGDYIIALRREFHKHPELALEEYETSKKIKEELDKIGVTYVECGKTGVIATVGKGTGRTIALRADMDALKIEENTGVDYTSENLGVMHACGHDSHMASLIGATIILKKYEDELPGKIIIIFQPAEENSSGAKLIVESGHLDKVDEIFGLHVFGDIECGKISIQKGNRMAASQKFKIFIKGKSGHAGKPHQCVDATLVCAATVMGIQAIVSREIDPIDPAVVTIGHMVSGASHNIISGEALIEGTVRMFSDENAKKIETSIKRIAYSTAIAHGAVAIIEYNISSHPVVFNDEAAVKTALEGARKIFDKENIVCIPKMMLGEDFSIYQKKIPGVFVFVGGGNSKIGRDFPNHNERFNIDERAVLISTKLYLAYALEA
ncbi:M20 metallopeptidase family protein [Clostridium gasigenes]|uniref:Amidohydrolase n=1 Tax=Clostridium gasigenes TaxID=94869 RepID=A0A1H0LCI2_9CLOT|nr:amidohydrolase [Clostridium gasigenes]SDO65660.1 amidohydrolase [Clostridium gasigenes]